MSKTTTKNPFCRQSYQTLLRTATHSPIACHYGKIVNGTGFYEGLSTKSQTRLKYSKQYVALN